MINELVDHPATKRIALAAIAAVMFAGIVAAATKSDDGNVGEGRLTAHGRALITQVDGARREVSGVVALHTGDTVEAVDGTMTIDLPDGSTIEVHEAPDMDPMPDSLLAGRAVPTSAALYKRSMVDDLRWDPELRNLDDWVARYTLSARGMVLRMTLRMG